MVRPVIPHIHEVLTVSEDRNGKRKAEKLAKSWP
jgi:hypothetical protein